MTKKTTELWLIWRSRAKENRRRYRVGVLSWTEDGKDFKFRYDFDHDFKSARDAGFAGYPGFDDFTEGKTYESPELFYNIASRVPKRTRDDYLDLLNKYGLDATAKDYEILIATRGRQITDNFEFVPAFNEDKIEFEIAGVSHREEAELKQCSECGALKKDAKITLKLDPHNEYDKYAIKLFLPIKGEDAFIGYVPRYYSRELTEKIESGASYSAVISRVDLNTANKDEKISARISLIFGPDK